MNVEVERGADVGVSEDDAHGLVVAVALYAPCGEAVAQAMKLDNGNVKSFQQAVVVVTIGARFGRLTIVGQDVERAVYYFHQGCKYLVEFARQRYLAVRILRLGRTDNQLRVAAVAINDVDALNGLGDGDNSLGEVNVLPCQGADLAYAHTSR